MQYWLMKSEPSAYSWQQLNKDGKTGWTGVRNFQASANMKKMQKGDRVFFYHSNEGLEIVGIMEIAKEYHPDPTDKTEKFGMVEVKPVAPVPTPVTMKEIKATPSLKDMVLVKNSRLSVQPVTAAEWKQVCKMGGVTKGM
jgi:predicted RNA-binding protein with PUA-like domain